MGAGGFIMLFLVVGVIMLALWFGDIEPVSTLKWYWLAIPFGLAWVWWDVIDPMFGLSQKTEARKYEERKAARIEKQRENLGLGTKGKGRKK
jgi:small Trp-rich protein